jgi:hypothetical protein
MDASTHADKKGARKERRDDVRHKGSEGRYEGGNDSDQARQAAIRGKEGFEEGKDFLPQPAARIADTHLEEEE